jgi:glycosyltransferase 2 family protein
LLLSIGMKKSALTILQYLFFLGLGIFFVWLSVKGIGKAEMQKIRYSFIHARHWVIVPVLVMLLGAHYIRALRWKLMMEPLGYHPGTFNTWAAVMIGYLVNAGVPRLGEVVKCTLLAKYENVRADKLVGTIVVERIIDVICLLIVFFIALLLQGHIIGDYLGNLFSGFFHRKVSETSTPTLLVVGICAVLFILLFWWVLRRFGHIDMVAKLKHVLKGVAHGLSSIGEMKRKWLFIFYTVLIWALYLLSTTAGIYALQETDHLGLSAGLTTLVMGSVGMILTPGGIGAYPLLVAELMELYGLDKDTVGAALGWLLWSAQTVIILAGGLIFSGLFSYHNKRRKIADS